MNNLFIPRNWFFVVIQGVSLIALIYAIAVGSSLEYWIISLLGYTAITCLGITVTFHRLLTHKSYVLSKPLEYLFTLFGNLGCTGSSIGWVFVHRTHHRFSDKPGDPHSPVTRGAIGAMIGDYSAEFNKWLVKDIASDRVHRTLHKYYVLIVLGTLSVMYMIEPMMMVHALLIPIFMNSLVSRMSNWIDHDPMFGSRPAGYDRDQAHNVWWWSWITFGEGWHYNHHSDPGNYRIGKLWYQFDPGKYVIAALMKLGLAREASYAEK